MNRYLVVTGEERDHFGRPEERPARGPGRGLEVKGVKCCRREESMYLSGGKCRGPRPGKCRGPRAKRWYVVGYSASGVKAFRALPEDVEELKRTADVCAASELRIELRLLSGHSARRLRDAIHLLGDSP